MYSKKFKIHPKSRWRVRLGWPGGEKGGVIRCEWNCLRTWSTWLGAPGQEYGETHRELATASWNLQSEQNRGCFTLAVWQWQSLSFAIHSGKLLYCFAAIFEREREREHGLTSATHCLQQHWEGDLGEGGGCSVPPYLQGITVTQNSKGLQRGRIQSEKEDSKNISSIVS